MKYCKTILVCMIVVCLSSCFDFFNSVKFTGESLLHSTIGNFTYDKGGHLQSNINLLDKLGIEYSITKTFSNGVRVGRIYTSDGQYKDMHSWFPKNWNIMTLKSAINAVTGTPDNKQIIKDNKLDENVEITGIYKNVKLIVIIKKIANNANNKIENIIIAVYPDMINQPETEQPAEPQKNKDETPTTTVTTTTTTIEAAEPAAEENSETESDEAE